jgi:hypothetical protein
MVWEAWRIKGCARRVAHRKALGRLLLHVLLDARQVPRHLCACDHPAPRTVTPTSATAAAASATRRHPELLVVSGAPFLFDWLEDALNVCYGRKISTRGEELIRNMFSGMLARMSRRNLGGWSGAPEPSRGSLHLYNCAKLEKLEYNSTITQSLFVSSFSQWCACADCYKSFVVNRHSDSLTSFVLGRHHRRHPYTTRHRLHEQHASRAATRGHMSRARIFSSQPPTATIYPASPACLL